MQPGYLEDAAAGDQLPALQVDNEHLVNVVSRRRVEQQGTSRATSHLAERLRALRVIHHWAHNDRLLTSTQVVGVQPVEMISGAGEQRLRRPVDGKVL